MERNIKLLYVFRFLRTFTIFAAVVLPFFQLYDVSQTQFYLMQSIFAVTIVVLEVPSGYFADLKGRKTALLVGVLFIAVGYWIYALGDQIAVFIFGELLLGIGYSFISGADEALAFDSYQALDRQEEYKQFEAKSNSYMALSEASASVLGGLLAIISIRTPIIAHAALSLLTIPIALLVVEPDRRTNSSTVSTVRPSIIDAARTTLVGNKQLRWFVLYGAIVSALTHTAVWLTQPYYQLVDIPIGWFGVLWAAQSLALGLFSRVAVRYESALGRRSALTSLPIIGVVTYIGLAVYPTLAVLPLILGFYFVRGVQTPMLRQAVNELVTSDVRATVLSINNLVKQLLYAALGPIVGVAVDAYSLRTGLFFSALLYGVLGAAILIFATSVDADRQATSELSHQPVDS